MQVSAVPMDDVQKKIVPWNNSQEILRELFPGIDPSEGRSHEGKSGLILVASLVQKPANLGGNICKSIYYGNYISTLLCQIRLLNFGH